MKPNTAYMSLKSLYVSPTTSIHVTKYTVHAIKTIVHVNTNYRTCEYIVHVIKTTVHVTKYNVHVCKTTAHIIKNYRAYHEIHRTCD